MRQQARKQPQQTHRPAIRNDKFQKRHEKKEKLFTIGTFYQLAKKKAFT
jgi:hypothetical protein